LVSLTDPDLDCRWHPHASAPGCRAGEAAVAIGWRKPVISQRARQLAIAAAIMDFPGEHGLSGEKAAEVGER
jgi:hypothetical protein